MSQIRENYGGGYKHSVIEHITAQEWGQTIEQCTLYNMNVTNFALQHKPRENRMKAMKLEGSRLIYEG
jgi:hypothetical protein